MSVIHVTTENFDRAVNIPDKIIVIDFFATWCGPCKMLGPVVEQAAVEMNDVIFYKVDIDDEMNLAQRYQIMSVPTLLFLKNGQVVKKSIGAISLDELKEMIRSLS